MSATMTRQGQSNVDMAVDYYHAVFDHDFDTVARFYDENIDLVGPLGNNSGKVSALEAVKKFASMAKTQKIRVKCSSDDSVILASDIDFGDPIGICRAATLMTFKNGLITHLELFFDARPFEKVMK